MTSTTFFIIFIPILAILLLAINLILAPHNPYLEKDSVFECGFHSFLGQNRTQFSVSFFIFGLLFLLFDLEILLVYPYSVSSYTNDIYGLVVMMVFFVLLTLGFIFELGKNALTIDSRQTSYNNGDLSTPYAFMSNIHNELLGLSSNYIGNSPIFVSNLLKSEMGISEIITQIDTFLPQLANFINQFSSTVSKSGISVITDTIGTMSIDIPQDMSNELGNELSTKIGVIDRLITTRSQDINDLLEKGAVLENKLKLADSQYVSQLTDRMQEYKRLISSYKHS
jgi:NADH-ubiquinone oxidoreductase chain 3